MDWRIIHWGIRLKSTFNAYIIFLRNFEVIWQHKIFKGDVEKVGCKCRSFIRKSALFLDKEGRKHNDLLIYLLREKEASYGLLSNQRIITSSNDDNNKSQEMLMMQMHWE